ncbi:MAG: hypothetical protein AAGC47_11700 [Bacteroidota bacterium]
MSTFNYDASLVQLIGSLTKAEKRYFKIHSNRSSGVSSGFQFLLLFDVVDRSGSLDQKKLEKTIPDLTPKKLSDLKRHLYKQILESLRIFNAEKGGFRLYTQIERARVLYNKGLFLDSLHLLSKAKIEAKSDQDHLRLFEILAFEKEIESTHVTRSHAKRSEELENETNSVRAILRAEADWSEFALKLYSKYLEKGHVNTEEEHREIKDYFEREMPPVRKPEERLFFEWLYFHQSYGWYYFIIQNFVQGFRHSRSEVNLYHRYPQFKLSHPHLYIKALHNCLSVLYNCMDAPRHQAYLQEMDEFVNSDTRLDSNTRRMAFVYLNSARLNSVILKGEFSQSRDYLKSFEKELDEFQFKLDDYRLMIFWYKMASIYFTMGDFQDCNRLLNEIINPNQKKLREDLQCFARLLSIITHFELGNSDLLAYLIKSTYRFLLKMNEITRFHEVLIDFLKTSLFKAPEDLKGAFAQLKEDFENLNDDRYEQRALLYLDATSWLESKIENRSVEEVIYEKRQGLR